MDHKQKFAYTVLGAVIMLIGISVGSIVSPPLIAQKDGVFGEIQCSQLTVVDKAGRTAIALTADEVANRVLVNNTAGKAVIGLVASERVNRILVTDKTGKSAVDLRSGERWNEIAVFDRKGNIRWDTVSD